MFLSCRRPGANQVHWLVRRGQAGRPGSQLPWLQPLPSSRWEKKQSKNKSSGVFEGCITGLQRRVEWSLWGWVAGQGMKGRSQEGLRSTVQWCESVSLLNKWSLWLKGMLGWETQICSPDGLITLHSLRSLGFHEWWRVWVRCLTIPALNNRR